MENEEIWKDQLLCFCPQEEIIRKIAAGEDGIHNETRKSVAQTLCKDFDKWGWFRPIESLVDETRRKLSPGDTEMLWLPESTMSMQKIVDFFQEGTFDANQEQHLFEIAGQIAEDDLRRAVTLPFEVGIARLGERKIAWSGFKEDGHNYAYSKKRNPILHWIDRRSDAFLHTHPCETGHKRNTPSWDDLQAAESSNPQLIAHTEGLLEFNGLLLEKVYGWMHDKGIMKNYKWKPLSDLEFTKTLRDCCIETGIIGKEGLWGGEVCGELMGILNGK